VWMVWGPAVLFISSRRLHTSAKRDWSSDVCAADLRSARRPTRRVHGREPPGRPARRPRRLCHLRRRQHGAAAAGGQAPPRRLCGSEERRGGREGRKRWGGGDERGLGEIGGNRRGER